MNGSEPRNLTQGRWQLLPTYCVTLGKVLTSLILPLFSQNTARITVPHLWGRWWAHEDVFAKLQAQHGLRDSGLEAGVSFLFPQFQGTRARLA